ncbi:hypothetical protein L1987_13152 [Smallanthus sonchifolius]|uniref:Uncharacterized protein n=1 Tax=Smallanthus sonchifolius TaxID=185202 RepID=A0ACB9JHU9_9ASTR|nr:hypothetical protein L1987_13152 [Smallanthus sonchifolius]
MTTASRSFSSDPVVPQPIWLLANAKRNFDETLEAHVKLAVDLRRTDLKLTGSLSLPHGSGKALRVAVFAEGAAADEARAAGADLVGGEDLIEGIKNGSINIKEIDKCIAMPQLMPRIGKEVCIFHLRIWDVMKPQV